MLANWGGKEEQHKEEEYEKYLKCGKGNGQNLGHESLTIKPKGQSGQQAVISIYPENPFCESQTMEENHSLLPRASQASL